MATPASDASSLATLGIGHPEKAVRPDGPNGGGPEGPQLLFAADEQLDGVENLLAQDREGCLRLEVAHFGITVMGRVAATTTALHRTRLTPPT
jgi:hypothetical protein